MATTWLFDILYNNIIIPFPRRQTQGTSCWILFPKTTPNHSPILPPAETLLKLELESNELNLFLSESQILKPVSLCLLLFRTEFLFRQFERIFFRQIRYRHRLYKIFLSSRVPFLANFFYFFSLLNFSMKGPKSGIFCTVKILHLTGAILGGKFK